MKRFGWPARTILRIAVSVVIVGAIFGLALPRFASYQSVRSSVGAMTWPRVLLVAAAAAASLASSWAVICSVLPSVRLREAAVVNLGSSAVANTVPVGGALAIGVSWAMLSSWGISTADYVLYTLVSGVWNVFARLGLPVLALLVMVTVTRPGAGLIAAAAAGLVLLGAAAAGFGLLLRSESFAFGAGRALQYAAGAACRLARRPLPPGAAGWVPGFRGRTAALLAAPGGLGVTELGLIGTLAAGAGHRASAQVTAAVLLYRAVTYLPSIPLGAVACLTWRHAPTLIRAPARATVPRRAIAPAPAPAPSGRGTVGRVRSCLVGPGRGIVAPDPGGVSPERFARKTPGRTERR